MNTLRIKFARKYASLVPAVLLVLCCLVTPVSGQAQSAASIARNFYQVAISPDGKRVAWVESLVDDNGEPTGNSAIYVQDLKSPETKPRRISASTAGTNASERRRDLVAGQPGVGLSFRRGSAGTISVTCC